MRVLHLWHNGYVKGYCRLHSCYLSSKAAYYNSTLNRSTHALLAAIYRLKQTATFEFFFRFYLLFPAIFSIFSLFLPIKNLFSISFILYVRPASMVATFAPFQAECPFYTLHCTLASSSFNPPPISKYCMVVWSLFAFCSASQNSMASAKVSIGKQPGEQTVTAVSRHSMKKNYVHDNILSTFNAWICKCECAQSAKLVNDDM